MKFLHVFLIVFIVLLVFSGGFLAYRKSKNAWPFNPPKMHGLYSGLYGDAVNPPNSPNQQPTKLTPGGMVFIVIIMILVLALVIASIYTTVFRYKIAGEAIHSGNTGVAVAALSPEIGQGVGSILGDITGHRFGYYDADY